jgi:hypothetical protein
MGTTVDPRKQAPHLGLCASCLHRQEVRNTRGSVFSLCLRSREDDAYPRYPRLPVLECKGHEPREA